MNVKEEFFSGNILLKKNSTILTNHSSDCPNIHIQSLEDCTPRYPYTTRDARVMVLLSPCTYLL